jgi:hypothetical protein
MQMLVPAQTQPQHVVKPDEMVHVGVRHEDIIDLQEFAGRKSVHIAKIEKQ